MTVFQVHVVFIVKSLMMCIALLQGNHWFLKVSLVVSTHSDSNIKLSLRIMSLIE